MRPRASAPLVTRPRRVARAVVFLTALGWSLGGGLASLGAASLKEGATAALAYPAPPWGQR